MKLHKLGLTVSAAIILALAGTASAQARDWAGAGHAVDVQGSNGGGGVLSTQASGDGQGTSTVKRSWKRNKGATASSSTTRQLNRQNHSLTRATTGTGPKGGTWKGNSTTTKTANGLSTTQSVTGPAGNTTTRDGTTTKTANGWTSQGTVTGPNGKTTTYDDTVAKTGNGDWTTTGGVTGPNGKTTDINNTGTVSANGISKNQSATGPGGQTVDRSTNLQGNGDGGVTKTITQPNGQTRDWTATPAGNQ